MPKHQSRTRAPGDEFLPDLALNMPLQHAQPHPEILDMVSIDLLRQHLLYNKTAEDPRTHGPIDEVSRTRHRRASASVKPKPHPGHRFDLGHDTKARNNDPVAWRGRGNATCASCSKWSLACVHAAALNAFDEHDSDSDECYATRIMQQLICLQNGCGGLEEASRRSQHEKHQGIDSPMVHRWVSQSPRQEYFNGMAITQSTAAGAIKSRL
jgi:hypothetical protein